MPWPRACSARPTRRGPASHRRAAKENAELGFAQRTGQRADRARHAGPRPRESSACVGVRARQYRGTSLAPRPRSRRTAAITRKRASGAVKVLRVVPNFPDAVLSPSPRSSRAVRPLQPRHTCADCSAIRAWRRSTGRARRVCSVTCSTRRLVTPRRSPHTPPATTRCEASTTGWPAGRVCSLTPVSRDFMKRVDARSWWAVSAAGEPRRRSGSRLRSDFRAPEPRCSRSRSTGIRRSRASMSMSCCSTALRYMREPLNLDALERERDRAQRFAHGELDRVRSAEVGIAGRYRREVPDELGEATADRTALPGRPDRCSQTAIRAMSCWRVSAVASR